MSKQKTSPLRETIDRMVEEAIRRVLPGIMNEVLLRTIASSGVSAPVVREDRRPTQQPRPAPKRRSGRPDLTNILDESAGSEFYGEQAEYEEEPIRSAVPTPGRSAAVALLPPELQEMTEGMNLDDDIDGGSWEEERQSAIAPRGDDVGDVGVAARKVGVDFHKMKSLSEAITRKSKPVSSVSAEDMRNRQQFEEQRLRRMRERLNGGKPLG